MIALVVVGEEVYVLDLAAKLDQTAEYLCHEQWGTVAFPPPFGRESLPEVFTISAFVCEYCRNATSPTWTANLEHHLN